MKRMRLGINGQFSLATYSRSQHKQLLQTLFSSNLLFGKTFTINITRFRKINRFFSNLPNHTDAHKRKIPTGYLKYVSHDMTCQSHMRWMLQKDMLQQDALLVSTRSSSAIYCRRLVMAYAEYLQKPVEIVTISSNTIVSDILVKRKRRCGSQQSNNAFTNTMSLYWEDQAAVRAALHGHLLILDGLHRADSIVIAALNSLLSKREIYLDDGRTLIPADVYNKLKDDDWIKRNPHIVPVHMDFRVVALWTKNVNLLDASIRSRFQIRRFDAPPSGDLYDDILRRHDEMEPMKERINSGDPSAVEASDDFRDVAIPDIFVDKSARELALLASLMSNNDLAKLSCFHFPLTAVHTIHRIRTQFPLTPIHDLLTRAYPYASTESRLCKILDFWPMASASRKFLHLTCQETCVPLDTNFENDIPPYEFNRVEQIHGDPYNVVLFFSRQKVLNKEGLFTSMFNNYSSNDLAVKVASGGMHSTRTNRSNEIELNERSKMVLVAMFQEHFAGRDILLVSPKGEGKSVIARQFCSILGYSAHIFPMHKCMTANDLLFQATDDYDLNCHLKQTWIESPLLKAARMGQVCILDGVDKISPDAFATLQGLLIDREVVLPDGTQYKQSVSNDDESHFKIHDSFRVICLASIPIPGSLLTPEPPTWLTEDVISMFATIPLPALNRERLIEMLKPLNPTFTISDWQQIYNFYQEMLEVSDDCGVHPFTIRSLVRFVKRGLIPDVIYGKRNLPGSLRSHFLSEMLLNSQGFALETILFLAEIEVKRLTFWKKERGRQRAAELKIQISNDTVKIGEIEIFRLQSKNLDLVPDPLRIECPERVCLIQLLLSEWSRGERAFLLVGNRNVGINKFSDGVCGLINCERERLNLNQNWTIEKLTGFEQGQSDSPLVRALINGRAVVISGIDESSSEVKSLIKMLAADQEMLLSNGQTIRKLGNCDGDILIHPNFSLWILTNRPSNLFCGDTFFHDANDCFSCHYVPPVDIDVVIKDLRPLYPKVDASIFARIFKSFDELRTMYESGDLEHPYYTKDAIAIVKHLQMFPDQDVSILLHDVLDFDSFDESQYNILENTFKQYGFPIPSYADRQDALNKSLGCGRFEVEHTSSSDIPLSASFSVNMQAFNRPVVGTSQVGGSVKEYSRENMDVLNDSKILGEHIDDEMSTFKSMMSTSVMQSVAVNDRSKADSIHEIPTQISVASIIQKLKDGHVSDLPKIIDDSIDSRNFSINQLYTVVPNETKIATEKKVQEMVAEKLADVGATEFEIYRNFIVPFIGEVNELRKKFMKFSSPKRLCVIIDCSGSMHRFNSLDRRLTRSIEAAAIFMETCWGIEKKWDYRIIGQNGESPCIDLVPFGNPPMNGNDRFQILQKIIAQSQFCTGGDNTLQAMMNIATSNETDLAVVISDGNLEKYDIQANNFVQTLRKCKQMSTTKFYFIFLGGHLSEAINIIDKIPKDQGYVSSDSREIPYIFQLILEDFDPNFPKQDDARTNIIDILAIRDAALKKKGKE